MNAPDCAGICGGRVVGGGSVDCWLGWRMDDGRVELALLMNEWMDGWLNAWMGGLMVGWLQRRGMRKRVGDDGATHAWTGECCEGRMSVLTYPSRLWRVRIQS